jgi:putative flippase GtrA
VASLIMQFLLYLVVGGLSFCVDIGIFVLLQSVGVPVIPASITSFITATGANYLLSTTLAFQSGRFRRHIELVRFLSVVLVGLVLNTGFVWLFVYPLEVHPTVAKIVAVPIVLGWNYFGRRLLVFHDRLPLPIAARLLRLRHMRRRDPEIDWVRDRQPAARTHTRRQPVRP